MKRIAVFASGNGSNAENITRYFATSDLAKVEAIYCNNPKAHVIRRATNLKVPLVLFDREKFYASDVVLRDLQGRKIDLIVLAGFLWLMPGSITKAFSQKIVNIHPALLPSFGGKGMFGDNVHDAVIEAGERESGITIHLIDEVYDHGTILLQVKCKLSPDETPESLAKKIHQLEYEHYPKVIEQLLEEQEQDIHYEQ
ncbi:MAG: phosphoribosylglycinamide formyltransferase [Lentimicrobiaceae bacterium]|jgi:phosphoribosylglycinamide formyltransferase-1|nr:phosphoribosylglycinamide formyltransferase [Lentimicrobiaceae bacterium]MDD4598896.1 phosphoribosylglycinamide formyltransferase [Lentimicrobiaceae bacterium]MDY0026421.1 phosphoribosylglycinamide formyltransferase [Lentimicrobium sp.]HAH59524.1 phosphoribosylglycinamide formyltransferase [Bacteroidales bacterium]